MTARARPLVLAAPSGAGKTSIARALIDRHDAVFSLSATTRAARPAEQHGVDYHFVDDAGFDELIERGELLEYAVVHGRRYGTLRSGVERALAAGRSVLLDIDVQGARRVRDALPDAVLVFILPPSAAEMLRRLEQRGSESRQELVARLRTARAELDAALEFDYVMVNDDFEDTVRRIEAVLNADPAVERRPAGLDELLHELRSDIDRIIQRSS